ncbi:MAG TPA: hypothetical protein DHN29_06040 [Cytophagales bacterium]|nr:hypothetical protein [Cytophagales bacterium]|tara:strand:+ start:595 stop:1230 length:636 start_codon:yes stop_codon:yes gene_type:complete
MAGELITVDLTGSKRVKEALDDLATVTNRLKQPLKMIASKYRGQRSNRFSRLRISRKQSTVDKKRKMRRRGQTILIRLGANVSRRPIIAIRAGVRTGAMRDVMKKKKFQEAEITDRQLVLTIPVPEEKRKGGFREYLSYFPRTGRVRNEKILFGVSRRDEKDFANIIDSFVIKKIDDFNSGKLKRLRGFAGAVRGSQFLSDIRARLADRIG